MMAVPRLWVRIANWILTYLFALTAAVAVMVQWALWLALTMQFLGGWGGIVGGLIVAVQIWLMFGTATTNEACEIPKA